MLKSGVHATGVGVLLAMTTPLRASPVCPEDVTSPLYKFKHGLHPRSAFPALPIFGFANAGVSLARVTGKTLLDPVTLGVAIGLFLRKQVGVFGSVVTIVRLGFAQKSAHACWRQIYGV